MLQLEDLERETDERFRSEEMRKRSEAQMRNLRAIEKNLLDSTELRLQIEEQKSVLAAKKKEIAALEIAITSALSGKAAKIAVIHRLSILYAVPLGQTTLWPEDGDEGFDIGAPVIRGTATDYTEELLRELEEDSRTKPEREK